ncbi:MAG: hypothetical protein K2N58_06765 [Treponemataceae bacterium]|nr:hypothetical protein [Treponemataceae bacterium]
MKFMRGLFLKHADSRTPPYAAGRILTLPRIARADYLRANQFQIVAYPGVSDRHVLGQR